MRRGSWLEGLSGGFRREKRNNRRSQTTWLIDTPSGHMGACLPRTSALAIAMEKLQARLQAASTEYQKLQNDLSVAVDSRQRLDAQLQENEMVKKVG